MYPAVPNQRFERRQSILGAVGKSAAGELWWNRYWLARVDYHQRNYAAAVDRLRGIVKTSPAYMMAWNVLGLSLEGDGKLDEAITSYKEAVRLNRELKPQPAWPSLNLGTLLTKMERLKEGEKAFARFNELQAVRRGE